METRPPLRPLRSEDDYKSALREVSACFDKQPAPGSADGDRFEILLTLVEAYESKHYPIDLPDPVEAIKFRMDQAGLILLWRMTSINKIKRIASICC